MSTATTRALRVGGSIVLLGAVVAMLPRGELQQAFRQASPAVLGLAVAAFVLCHVAAAFKWRMLGAGATDLSLGKALRAHFTGLVANLSPLGMIGGDLVRAGVAINGSSQSSAIVLTSVVDRIVDTGALMIVALAGFAWMGGRSTTAAVVLWGGFAVSVAGVVVLLAGHGLLRRSQNIKLAGIRDALDALTSRPALMVRALVLSVTIQGTLIALNAFIGASVGVQVSFAAWMLAWPAAKFAAYLPVGFAGFGVREAALVALMRPFGGAPGPVFAAGLLWDAVLVVGSVGGWVILSVARAAPRAPLGRRQEL